MSTVKRAKTPTISQIRRDFTEPILEDAMPPV
jgi:hypothetical protein